MVIVCVGALHVAWLVPPQFAFLINGLIVYPDPQLQGPTLVNSMAAAGVGVVTLQFCITLQVLEPMVTEKFVPVVAVLNASAIC